MASPLARLLLVALAAAWGAAVGGNGGDASDVAVHLRPESDLTSHCFDFPAQNFDRRRSIYGVYGQSPNLLLEKGSGAIDFTLHDYPGGNTWNLRDQLEEGRKPVVLIWGMYTCPAFQGMGDKPPIPPWDMCSYWDEYKLVEQYNDRVTFAHLYGPEPHPAVPGTNFDHGIGIDSYWSTVQQPSSYAERLANVERVKSMIHPQQVILPDYLPGNPYSKLVQPVWCSYGLGARPAMAISPDGSVFFQQEWLNTGHMAHELDVFLRGVGRFTILDAEDVRPLDQGSNFFVGPEHVGLPRAKVTMELLCEMNPDVKGEYVREDPDSQINKDPAFFSKFSLVIASQLHETTLRKMAALCWESSVPFLYVRSYRLLGHVRLALRGHCVVESKPEGNKPDLRIAQPWPELLEYCRSVDLEKQDDMLHGHTPWIVILVRKMEEWKAAHGGSLPNFQQRTEFQQSLKAAARDYDKELNYQEACKESYVAYAPPGLPGEVETILADAAAMEVGPKTSNFWLLARALGEFVKGEGGGLPPLSGEVPDMTSDTDSFITLQGLYKAKAAKDTAAVAALVDEGLAKAGRPRGSVPAEETEVFCKNARKLLTVTTRSVEEEYGSNTCNKDEISCELGDPYEVAEQTPIVWYLALRAADVFKTRNGRYPGEEDDQVEGDGQGLWTIMQEVLKGVGVETEHLSEKHAREIARYGASELHNVASVVGGIASQEAVKAITRQYTPLDNTIVYNGLAGVLGRYEL